MVRNPCQHWSQNTVWFTPKNAEQLQKRCVCITSNRKIFYWRNPEPVGQGYQRELGDLSNTWDVQQESGLVEDEGFLFFLYAWLFTVLKSEQKRIKRMALVEKIHLFSELLIIHRVTENLESTLDGAPTEQRAQSCTHIYTIRTI